MNIEVLLSVMNLKIKDLDKTNIKSPCTVINQCGKIGFRKYKNFKIYDMNSIGIGISRNMAINKSKADILIFADNDCVYYNNFEKEILNFYKNHPKADAVIFNFKNSKIKEIKKITKLNHFNYQRHATYQISFKKNKIKNIKINELFGGNSLYSHGEDTIFLKDCLKKKLKVYKSNAYIGKIINKKSTWFKGYTDKFFYDKGALYAALSPKLKYLNCLQYLIRHKNIRNKKFLKALKLMFKGAKSYKKGIPYERFNNCHRTHL